MSARTPSSSGRRRCWFVCGLLLAGATVWLGIRFSHAAPDASFAEMLYQGLPLYAGACVLYFAAIACCPSASTGRLSVAAAVAGLMRIGMCGAPSLDGADYQRYLWDGAMTAHGLNPYAHSPSEVLHEDANLPSRIRGLGLEARPTLKRINHPDLRTIYPPVAQALFGLAHLVSPFSLSGWRLILLLADLGAAGGVVFAARCAGMPLLRAVCVYGWNPLLVVETYAGGHLDLIAASLAVPALVLAWKRHAAAGGAMLALATGVKVWPLLLAGVAWRCCTGQRRLTRRFALAFCLAGVVLAVLYAPAFLGTDSGAKRYAGTWDANAGLFSLLVHSGSFMVDGRTAYVLPRYLLAGITLLAAALWSRRGAASIDDLFQRAGGILLIGLLLSPTLYPWYAVALVPLAALRPHPALLMWTLLLPLTCVEVTGYARIALLIVVHVPVWVALMAQLLPRIRPGATRMPSHA